MSGMPPVFGRPEWMDPAEPDAEVQEDPAGAWCDRCQRAVWPHDTCVGCDDDVLA